MTHLPLAPLFGGLLFGFCIHSCLVHLSVSASYLDCMLTHVGLWYRALQVTFIGLLPAYSVEPLPVILYCEPARKKMLILGVFET